MTRLGLGISINQSVVGSSKAPASLSFSPNPNLVYNPGTVISFSANSNSPGAITYQSDNPSVISISGNNGILGGVGIANITAFVAGDNNYSEVSATKTITVSKGIPTISFSVPSQLDTNAAPFSLNPTSNSPGAITYTSSNPSVISISGKTATVIGNGQAFINVQVESTTNYNSTSATYSITVAPSSANTWTPYRITGSAFGQYQPNEYVWYSGNIYKCLAANDGILPTNTVYWQLIKSGSLTFDTDANTWFTNVAAVSSVSSANKISINAFFASLKQGGVWNAIQQSNLFAGATSLSGALVPIVGNAPTNYLNSFIDSDYNYLTGLKGNASTKYLNTGRANNADVNQSSRHIYVCTTENAATAGTNIYLLGSGNIAGEARIFQPTVAAGTVSMSLVSSTQTFVPSFGTVKGFGMNRNSATTVIPFANGNLAAVTSNVLTPSATNIGIFATGTGTGKTDARIAFYSIGDSADCSIIDACVKTLLSALV